MSCKNNEEYEALVLDAAAAAIEAAYAFLQEKGHEDPLDKDTVIHSQLHDDVMWAFIRVWGGHFYSPFMKLIDFEGLLYPEDSGEYYRQVIPRQVADVIIQKASNLLEACKNDGPSLPEKMKNHLSWIVENGMPYGVVVADD